MIGWLRRLFTGEPDCRHEYATSHVVEVTISDLLLGEKKVEWRYHLKCKKCGWMCRRTL